jgi:predicted transcriptional regulator YdeE
VAFAGLSGEGALMKPTIIKGLRVVGVAVRTTLVDETDPDRSRAHSLWGRFVGDGLCYQVPRRINRCEFIELYTDYAGATHEEFTLLLGQRDFEFANDLPEGLTSIELPAQEYLRVVLKLQEEEVAEELCARLWAKVRQRFLQHPTYERAWTSDFAFVWGRFGKITLYVAVK